MSLLEVTGLTVRIGDRTVVDDVDLALGAGERLGLIGSSGSGKSLTSLAVLGLLPEDARVDGSIRFDGDELCGRSDRELSAVRGARIGMVFQEPLTALDPVMRVGHQVAGPLRRHAGSTRAAAAAAAVDLLGEVGLPDPAGIARRRPHEMSGGQRQRVGIAIALAGGPDLLIADEPTTALDVANQAEVVSLLDELVTARGMALLFITHDLAVVATVADRIVVMDGGRVCERGDTDAVLRDPQTPTARDMVAAARATAFGARSGPGAPITDDGAVRR